MISENHASFEEQAMSFSPFAFLVIVEAHSESLDKLHGILAFHCLDILILVQGTVAQAPVESIVYQISRSLRLQELTYFVACPAIPIQRTVAFSLIYIQL